MPLLRDVPVEQVHLMWLNYANILYKNYHQVDISLNSGILPLNNKMK